MARLIASSSKVLGARVSSGFATVSSTAVWLSAPTAWVALRVVAVPQHGAAALVTQAPDAIQRCNVSVACVLLPWKS